MFADDTVVSKGMVKYASQITRESIVDVGGLLSCPEAAVEGCSQSNVSGRALSHRQKLRGPGDVCRGRKVFAVMPQGRCGGQLKARREGISLQGMSFDSDGKGK